MGVNADYMNDYVEVRFNVSPCSEPATDILAALLCEEGYESFVPDSDGVTAYIKIELFSVEALNRAVQAFPMPDIVINWQKNFIEGQDWNHEWEKNYFKPIIIGDNKCVIHSSFHVDIPQCDYDIVIDPKMAFGTGHHSTTSLIIDKILKMEFAEKSVLDMGTGTGILAILAAMRGAQSVTAVEIDPMAHANAVENVASNGHPEINVLLGDASTLVDVDRVDVMFANINRNIILNDIDAYRTAIKPGGLLYLSGFYTEDVPVLEEKALSLGFEKVSVESLNNWCCLELRLIE